MRRELFENSPDNQIWIEGESVNPDSKTLFTISSAAGEATVLITPTEITPGKARMFVQAPPERVVTGNQVWEKRASGFIKTLGYVLSAVLITFSLLSMTGYVKARIVLTGSMEPSIKPGDIVITVDSERVVPQVGSVVAYQARQFNGDPVGVFTHRIIGGNGVDGWRLKGDNNPTPDIQQPKNNDILGVVIFVIPWLGNLLSKQVLFTVIPLIAGLWFLLDTLREVPNE
jgi:signal peptidase